jgi:hypothetical protein
MQHTLTLNKQLLNFYKMSFYLFSTLSLLAVAVLMPVNLKVRGLLTCVFLRFKFVVAEQHRHRR